MVSFWLPWGLPLNVHKVIFCLPCGLPLNGQKVYLLTANRGFLLFSFDELEFLWWQFTTVFENIVPIFWEFVCYSWGCCCEIIIKEDVELWGDICSFNIQNQSDTSCMICWYTKINGFSWLRCPFWNRFILKRFGIEDEARRSKSMKLFHSIMSFGWLKTL